MSVRCFCACQQFELWYMGGGGVEVCHCGHPRSGHIDDRGTCVGDVEVSK